MALGSSGATKRASTLQFIAEVDRNSLRRTLRGFADLEKSVDQFARAEIESARIANQLNRTNAEQKTGVSRLSNEFDELRLEMLQAADAAEKLDNSLDQAARQRKISGVAGGGSLRADIGGIGDIETAGRALGGGLGAAGFTQADRAIATFSELPASIEAIGQLKQAVGKDMKLAFNSLKNSIGASGLGLIGATVALTAAYALAARATAKRTAEITTELQERQKIFALEATQTRAQILDRLNQLAVERDIAVQQREVAADAVAASREAVANQNIFLRSAIKLGDTLNISDSSMQALRDELERTSTEANRLRIEHENLTEALSSEAVAVNSLQENQKQANREREAELQLVNQNTIAKQQQHVITQALAEEEERLHDVRKRDFNRANEQRREAEAAKEFEKNFNIFLAAAEKFAKLQEEISKIQAATAEKIAAIQSRLNEQRIEAQRKFAEDWATAQRAFAERRLKIREAFQDAMFRIQRQFARSQQTAVGERDALAAHNAATAAADQQEDATRQRDTALRDQRRAEVERLRILRQSLERQLRTQAAAAARQIRTAIQSAQAQIAIRQQQMQAETAIMAQFAVSGVRSVQQFVAGALGALGALAGAAGGAGSTSLNNAIDARIETTFGGSGGGGGNFAR